jgi:hypothetical protein
MGRSTVRRAAALAATGALAVLAGAGPALAADGSGASGTQNAASQSATSQNAGANVQGAQGAPQEGPQGQDCPRWHHHGLVSGLLDGVVHLVDALL